MLRLTQTGVMHRVLVAAAAIGTSCAGGWAAPQPAAPPLTVQTESIEGTAARYVSRVAVTDLRIVAGTGALAATDYRIATQLLETAHRLAPDDVLILRQLIEASENAGDSERVGRYTRELVRLDPTDTVAQLRLISAKIRDLQNADERLAAYDRWLSADGASVDGSVRSRLALDAALLSREKGDAKGFATRLGRAIELDATNKDAATLALAFYSQQVGEPVGQFELMLAVLSADPLDMELHRTIAQHLTRHGAFRGALRFYGSLTTLLDKIGDSPREDESADIDVVQWLVNGPRPLIERYNRGQFEKRQKVRRDLEIAQQDKQPLDGMPVPEAVRLTMATEWVRFAAAAALQDPQLVDSALNELVNSAAFESEMLTKEDTRPKEMTPEEATSRMRGLLEEATFARLLVGRDLDAVATAMDVLRAEPGGDPDKLANLEAWNAYRKGDVDAAERLFKLRSDSNTLCALGLAVMADDKGDKAGAMVGYEAIARREAGTIPGAFAATRLEALTGKPMPLDAVAKRLEDLAAGVPTWVDTLIENPRRHVALEATLEKGDLGPLEPARMKIRLRNVGPAPLGVGSDGPVNSRFLIAPNVQIGTESFPTSSFLNVVSLDHRLRLLPQEELTAVVDAELPGLSMLLEQIGGAMSRVRYRILQGFEAVEDGIYREGPFSLATDAGPLRRVLPPKSVMDIVSLVRFAEQGTIRDLAEAIMAVRGRSFTVGAKLSDEDHTKFYAAVARRFPTLKPAEQMLVLVLTPTAVQLPAAAAVDQAAQASSDPGVRSVYLVARAAKADDPALTDRVTAERPELVMLAALIKSRIENGVISFATFAPPPEKPAPQAAPSGGAAVQPDK